jgi:hypothetical protein
MQLLCLAASFRRLDNGDLMSTAEARPGESLIHRGPGHRAGQVVRCAAWLLFAGPVLPSLVAQEALQFNVPYHCEDGTDKIITRCQSNARGEVCVWRDEKNGQVIGERFNIRSQMDGWLKVCKVQAKPSAPATVPPPSAPQAVTPSSAVAVLPTGTLNPPYLSGMPSIEKVKREIQGQDPTDTLARQVAVFNEMPLVTQRFLIADRHRHDVTPDEQKVCGQYLLAAQQLEESYKKTHTAAEAQEFFRLHGRYEEDALFFRDMFKLFSPAFMDEYRKVDRSANEWYQAHLDEEKRIGQGPTDAQLAQANKGNSPFVRNDPGTLAARRCVELGGSDLDCVGKGLSTGLMDMLGLGGLNLDPAAKAARTGLVISGVYQSENSVFFRFGDDEATLSSCGKLVELPLHYTVTRQGQSLLIQFANSPKPFTAVLSLDGGLAGPGPTDVQGQIITGYRHYTAYKRRVSDNSIVQGSQHDVAEPIYAPKLERCSIGALRSTGPVPSADLIPVLTGAMTGDNSKVKTTPAGPRMSGTYKNSGGLKIQFATEAAVVDCGEAHVASTYSVTNDATALRVTLDKAGGPLTLTFQPNGTLMAPGTTNVEGRVVSGSTPNGIAFAPRRAQCPVGTLAPHVGNKP